MCWNLQDIDLMKRYFRCFCYYELIFSIFLPVWGKGFTIFLWNFHHHYLSVSIYISFSFCWSFPVYLRCKFAFPGCFSCIIITYYLLIFTFMLRMQFMNSSSPSEKINERIFKIGTAYVSSRKYSVFCNNTSLLQ